MPSRGYAALREEQAEATKDISSTPFEVLCYVVSLPLFTRSRWARQNVENFHSKLAEHGRKAKGDVK